MSNRSFIVSSIVFASMFAMPLVSKGQTGVLHKQIPSSVLGRPLPATVPSTVVPSITNRPAGQNIPAPTRGVPSLGHVPRGLEQASRVAAPQATSGLEKASLATAKAGEKLAAATGPMKAGQAVAHGRFEKVGEGLGTVTTPPASAEAASPSVAPEAIQQIGQRVPVTTPRWRDRLRIAKPFSTR